MNVTNVYISLRTDGVAGTGTLINPYDGSTEAKFDALMKSFGPNTWIHLSPGTFMTFGGDEFSLRSGWTVQGAGRGKTIIKLAGHTSANPKHYNLSGGSVSNVKIEDLTCDGNDQGSSWPAHDVVGGIAMIGSTNLSVDNVEVINCYGDAVEGREQFSIFICGSGPQIGTRFTVRNCLTHKYAPGSTYTNGPDIAFCDKAEIYGSTDDGASHGFGLAGTTNSVITQCTSTLKTGTGFYIDTGPDANATIENNSFSASGLPIQFNSQSPAQSIFILNNNLKSSNSGGGSAAIALTGASGNNFVIKGNVFSYMGTTNSGLILNNAKLFTNLTVENNSSNVGLVGAGGRTTDITDVATVIEGNQFDLPLSSLTSANSSSDVDLTKRTEGSVSSTPTSAPTVQENDPQTVAQKLVAKDPVEAMKFVQQLPAGESKTAALKTIISTWVKGDPESAADYVLSMDDESTKQAAVETLSDAWADQDPEATAEWLASLPMGMQTDTAYASLAGKWASSDSDGAVEWLATVPAGSSRDAAIKSFSDQMVSTDPAEALKWASSIGDAKVQNEEVVTLLQKWMQTDPDNATLAVKDSELTAEEKASLLTEAQ